MIAVLGKRRIEKVANLSIVLAAIVVLVAVVKRCDFSSNDRNTAGNELAVAELKVDDRLPLENVDWAKARRTVVLALSTECQYCIASVPFYHRITDELDRREDYLVLAILPQNTNEAERFLSNNRILVDEIRRISLPSLGIAITPTIILVNKAGVIEKLLIGELRGKDQDEIVATLAISDTMPSSVVQVTNESSSSKDSVAEAVEGNAAGTDVNEGSGLTPPEVVPISEAELKRAKSEGRSVVIVDIRDRRRFGESHYPGAKNIPLDELEIRAINELKLSDIVVTDCACHGDDSPRIARAILNRVGFRNVFALTKN